MWSGLGGKKQGDSLSYHNRLNEIGGDSEIAREKNKSQLKNFEIIVKNKEN